MSDPVRVGADKSSSLNILNTIVAQQEDNLGPLIAIGNDGSRTMLTFDTDPPSPTDLTGSFCTKRIVRN
jgi:hypothetical protein